MNVGPLTCTRCNAALLAGMLNQPDLAPCPGCGSSLQVEVFPALFQQPKPGLAGEQLLIEAEAGCFYHPQRKAVLPCDGCGRFLCTLCDCQLGGQHLCPTCLETGRRKGKLKNLQNQRTLHDSIALALAVYPLLIFYFTVITAPMALYIALRHWNAPGSLVRGNKVRFVAAIVLAAAQIAGWGVLAYVLISGVRRNG